LKTDDNKLYYNRVPCTDDNIRDSCENDKSTELPSDGETLHVAIKCPTFKSERVVSGLYYNSWLYNVSCKHHKIFFITYRVDDTYVELSLGDYS
jgi:hypothetical protein